MTRNRTQHMHLDVEHLVELFHSQSQLFDLEGKLFVRRGEPQPPTTAVHQYQECLCRLRGNLLLIGEVGSTRSIDNLTIGLLILNNFEIKLCDSSHYEFCVHINKSSPAVEKCYFICNSRSERDKWIESIYLASFNFLNSFHKALTDDFNKKRAAECRVNVFRELGDSNSTDKSPLPGPTASVSHFILVKCDQLRHTASVQPSVCVKVFYRKLYIDKRWHYLGSTEIIQSQSPQFQCAIQLPPQSAFTELKFELFCVVEPEFDTTYLSAFAYFKCPEYIYELSRSFRLKLRSTVSQLTQPVGSLAFTIFRTLPSRLYRSLSHDNILWNNKSIGNLVSIKGQMKRSTPNLALSNGSQNQLDNANLNPFCNTISKSFSFKASPTGPDLIIEELMSESKFVFLIPQILMKLYSHDDETIIALIDQFKREHGSVQADLLNPLPIFHQRMSRTIKESLTQIIHFMSSFTFRASTNKKEPFLQFVPVNFHKQACRVFDVSKSSSITIFSIGAYANHNLGFDRCGMKSILIGKNEYPKVLECWTMLKKLQTALHCESRIVLYLEHMDKLEGNTLDRATIEPLYRDIRRLSEELVDLLSAHEVDEHLSYLNALNRMNIFDDEFQLEPIELAYLNIKACQVAMNDKLSNRQTLKSDIDSCNRKLRAAIESVRKIVFTCYLSLFTQLTHDQIESLFKLRFRHLTLYTQALTSLIIFIMDRADECAFVQSAHRTKYILMQYETLLSCYSDELGMLEDMTYALEEVASSVSILFSFDKDRPRTLMPDIDTFGDKIRLTFHLDSALMESAIDNFECKVMPLIFNIGVNEQATLAERLGFNAHQHDLNEINFNKLRAFTSKFYPNDAKAANLMGHLKLEMSRTVSKNINMLHLVQQLVRHLGGIRVTCCKSAKDRTGMSITLEETRHLFSLHELKEDRNGKLFQYILDTLRRDGTRIENAYKNIGARKYAFNRIQLLTFPRILKPPAGTYSTLET